MKLEHVADNRRTRVSQGPNVIWTEDELDRIRDMAGQRCTKAMIAKAFPNRTYLAVKVKLFGIRNADYDRSKRPRKGNGNQGAAGPNPLAKDALGVDDGSRSRYIRDMIEGNHRYISALSAFAQKRFAA